MGSSIIPFMYQLFFGEVGNAQSGFPRLGNGSF